MERLSVLTWCFLALSMLACGAGWRISLPNHYQLVYANAYEVAIAGPDNAIVVYPSIVEYAVIGDLVTGRADIPRTFPGQPAPQRRASGYFLLNTATGAISDGLSIPQWHAELRRAGIEDEPDLERPSRS
jgi:hypothetical protein